MTWIGQQMIEVKHFGQMPFAQAEGLQHDTHEGVARGLNPETILWGEHPPVVTAGKNARREEQIRASDQLAALGFSLAQTDRGGQITLHDIGQLVVYPIIRVMERGIGVRCYVEYLEQAVIDTLIHWRIVAGIDQQYPGVWVRSEKIAAIGIRIAHRVSRHGISLNVSNNLVPYDFIVPCGIVGKGVTSIAQQMSGSHCPSVLAVAERFIGNLIKQLDGR